MRLLCIIAVLVAGQASVVVTRASGQVTSYTTRDTDGHKRLTSVTVTHGGGAVIFAAGKLIPARIAHFRTDANVNVIVPAGWRAPTGSALAQLLDLRLNAGIINPGGADTPLTTDPVLSGADATPGMAIEFSQPVVNRPGADVVLFEMQRELASPKAGDPVHVSPLRFLPGLRTLTIERFDVDFEHARAQFTGLFDGYRSERAPQSLDDLMSGRRVRALTQDDFKALAVGIDLSDLGYADDASITGLFLQNARASGAAVDPVCIVGLPLPEPESILQVEPPLAEVHREPVLLPMLDGPLADVDEIVFTVRVPGNDHWYANFGFYSSPRREYPPQRAPDGQIKLPPIYKDGGRLCKLNLRTRELAVLLDDPEGAVRDPQVSYDGRRILFSYRRAGQPYYRLYEVDTDGTNLRQLTDGPYNDIEPTRLPDGGIMFCSDRCRRFVNCWVTPVATLYRSDGDGRNIRMISTNVEHDNTPWVLADGRVIYMRWEYVDRSQTLFHHLWTTNPDGTGQMVFYGNMHPGVSMLDAKPIPDTSKVVASFSPGHGRAEHAGHITIVDPALGPDEIGAAQRISRGQPVYRDPYAFSENCFLVAEGSRLLVMDGRGRTETIYELPTAERKRQCHEPRPLRMRPREPVIPSRIDPRQAHGRLVLADVYRGRNMVGVKRGEIRKLLVLEQLPKPVNFSGGPWPTSIGGTFTLTRILGTVPVEQDGSAYFEVPALRSLFFVALDRDGLAVKRMHSFLTVQPGEATGCVGCHEQRLITPFSSGRRMQAMQRETSRIEAIRDVPDVLDFPRDVQPILDRHCVRCHNPDDYKARVDLSADHTPLFCESYWTLTQRKLVVDGRNASRSNHPPRAIGSSASPLLSKLDASHHGVMPSPLEVRTVRLWIDASAPYAGTYAALGSGLSPVQFPVETMERRCARCHGCKPGKGKAIGGHKTYFRFGKKGPSVPLVHTLQHLRDIRAQVGYFKYGYSRPPQSLCNLSRPEKSLLLRAHLSKQAGGHALGGEVLFDDTDEPDYQSILTAIRAAAERLNQDKRFDLAGFRPNDYYLYHMQRYGVLPATLAPDAPVDPYALDRTYWQSFWYRPVAR